jgi:hypothetical protein
MVIDHRKPCREAGLLLLCTREAKFKAKYKSFLMNLTYFIGLFILCYL